MLVERVDLDLAAERGLDEADRHLGQHVLAVALEPLVTLDVEHDVEVAGGAARSDLALAGEPQGLAVVDAGRHADVERGRLGPGAAPAAVLARVLDRLAGAAAVRTRGLHHEEALGVDDLALALAGAADLGPAARPRAVAAAGRARDVAADLDVLGDAPDRLGEGQVDIDAQVGAAGLAATAAAAAEEVAEDVAERREDVLDVGVAAGRAVDAADAVEPEAVVALALFVVGQDRVRVGGLLELLLGLLVPRVVIGVVLLGEAVVRLLQLGRARLPIDFEDFIEIAHGVENQDLG